MKKTITLAIFLIAVFTLFSETKKLSGNETNNSFSQAKKLLSKVVYSSDDVRKTFYCDCSYDTKNKIKSEGCSYHDSKRGGRNSRVEWEHIVPAAAFGGMLTEWRSGHPTCVDGKGKSFKGRNCASKVNKKFQYMQADMYNLVPAIGRINADRSNFSYGIISGEAREYGACDFEVKNRTAEPRDAIRGDIARTYFYMDAAYPEFELVNSKNRALFEAWDKADPVDQWECKRGKLIESVQKNRNLILEKACISAFGSY